MTYQSLYRKYRPNTFDDVIGKKNIVKSLQNAIKLNKISHAYIFTGPRGTGKTTMAKLLAKSIVKMPIRIFVERVITVSKNKREHILILLKSMPQVIMGSMKSET